LAPSLWKQAITLHLYRRLSGGRWEAVAQLIPDDDSPANVITGIDYDTSFAIDSGVMVSNGRVYDAAAPTISYVFSNFDPCLGHRGNWIELTPQRWAISHQGGRTYSIVTSDYANQSGN